MKRVMGIRSPAKAGVQAGAFNWAPAFAGELAQERGA
jgi:hypothetical protein